MLLSLLKTHAARCFLASSRSFFPNIKKSQTGFTLFELLVVIALIAIMTGLSVPAIRTTLFTDQLKASSRQLAGIITKVSQQAVREQKTYTLIVDFENNSVTKKAKSIDEEYEEPKLYLGESVKIADITSVHSGIQNNGRKEITFTKKGYVDKTYIHLREEERDMTLMLSPFLGVIEIVDTYISLE